METLKGKNVLIAGATGSIGSALAKLLAGSGANVFLAGRKVDKLKAVAEAIKAPADHIYELDITNADSVQQMADAVHSQVAQVDILINAAGIGIIKSFETLSIDEFQLSLQTNLTGTFLLVKAILPKMKEVKRGLIINIPGVLGKVGMAGASAYCASKYGLVGMMQSIREELKRTDIRITNIFLGGVDSSFWDTIDLRVQREKMIKADEAAKAIWFLCQQPVSGVISEMVLQPFNHQAI